MSSENSLFSIKLIFSGELALNILTVLGILQMNNLLSIFKTHETLIFTLIVSFMFPIIMIFTLIKPDKIITTETNVQWKYISIFYSVITYVAFFLIITNIEMLADHG
jgi:hypothetical protein